MIRKNINFIFRILSLTCILLAIGVFQVKAEAYRDQLEAVEKENARIAREAAKEAAEKYRNGEYAGAAYGYGGVVKVQVIIKEGGIDQVNLIAADKEDKAYLDMTTGILDKIVEKQGIEGVDTVSGATFTSKGLINAAGQAISRAVKE